ncbi:hypothetical protein DCM91_19940 [Chitinophaga costaii]|nr:hypothetical protein DCM91_19940 [Chitinophaga costaii]
MGVFYLRETEFFLTKPIFLLSIHFRDYQQLVGASGHKALQIKRVIAVALIFPYPSLSLEQIRLFYFKLFLSNY